MDPNETLRRMLAAAERINQANESSEDDAEFLEKVNVNDIASVVGHVAALNEWLSKGGFLPKKWER